MSDREKAFAKLTESGTIVIQALGFDEGMDKRRFVDHLNRCADAYRLAGVKEALYTVQRWAMDKHGEINQAQFLGPHPGSDRLTEEAIGEAKAYQVVEEYVHALSAKLSSGEVKSSGEKKGEGK